MDSLSEGQIPGWFPAVPVRVADVISGGLSVCTSLEAYLGTLLVDVVVQSGYRACVGTYLKEDDCMRLLH